MRSVTPASAMASDARKVSPSPTPSTSGEPRRAPTTRCGLRAKGLVVLDDAVVHDRDAPGTRRGRVLAGAVREMRVRVVHGRRAVRRPARVRDAGRPDHAFAPDERVELGDALGAARAL